MLDRTAEQQAREAEAVETDAGRRGRAGKEARLESGALPRSAWGFFITLSFSSLTRRIVFLNLAGLVALLVGADVSVAIPRRPDRRARAEPAGAERDHRRRDRRLRDGRKRRRHHRPGSPARIAGRRELRAGRFPLRPRIPDQSRTRRAGAAPPGIADQDPRAHLRSRGRAHSRQPQSLRPRRRAALRPAVADRRNSRA